MAGAKIFNALNGREMAAAIAHDVEERLVADYRFSPHLTYSKVRWGVRVRIEQYPGEPASFEAEAGGTAMAERRVGQAGPDPGSTHGSGYEETARVHHILETAGAVVVCEESCTGTRFFSDLVSSNDGSLDDELRAVADRYMNIHCACFTPNSERLDDIVRLAREYQVDGVVHYNLQFCHTYANEAVKVERVLAEQGIPLLRIESDYSDEDAGQLRTRIDAFLEMIRR